MNILKMIFKVLVASILVIGGVLLGGTIFTAKKIDEAGDVLEEKLH